MRKKIAALLCLCMAMMACLGVLGAAMADGEYQATPVVFHGEKVLNGRALKANEFRFDLYQADSLTDQNGTWWGETPNGANGRVSVMVVVSEPGDHFFYIEEVRGEDASVAYSEERFYVKVTATDDGTGKLDASVTTYDDEGNAAPIRFVNTYLMNGKITLGGELRMIDGRGWASAYPLEGFTFELYRRSADGTLTRVDAAESNARGEFFFQLEFAASDAGAHEYVIRQKVGAPKTGLTYDETEQSITVTVEAREEGKVDVTANPGREAVRFTNQYIPAAEIRGSKTLEGGALQDGAFTFELYALDDSGAALVQAVTNQNGGFAFDPLTFDAPGVYRYLVRENADANPQANVTYDASVYEVMVNVGTDAAGNVMTAETAIFKDGQAVDTIAFANVYSAAAAGALPQTGDSGRIGLWGAMLALSAVGMAALLRRRALKAER